VTALVLQGRGGGKSQAAATWLREGRDRIMLFRSEREAEDFCKRFQMNPRQVDTMDGWRNGSGNGRRGRRFQLGLDNADLFVQDYIRERIDFMTMTWAPSTMHPQSTWDYAPAEHFVTSSIDRKEIERKIMKPSPPNPFLTDLF